MLITSERPTARQIARHAWASLFEAACRMAPLFLGCLLLLIMTASRSQWLPGYDAWSKQLYREMPMFWAYLLTSSIGDILGLILLAPLAVAVHRFVLLGEVCKLPYFVNRASLRFALLLVGFALVQLLGIVLTRLLGSTAIGTLCRFVYAIIACWTLLVFPDAALEETSTDELFDVAIQRTKGNFWLIVRSLLLTVFILGLPYAVFQIGYSFLLTNILRQGVPQSLLSLCYMLINNSFKIAILTLGATTASWLCSYAAHRTASELSSPFEGSEERARPSAPS